jgi:hypothetical protein
MTKKKLKELYQNQIVRLAKMYLAKPVTIESLSYHGRIATLQCDVIRKKKLLKV